MVSETGKLPSSINVHSHFMSLDIVKELEANKKDYGVKLEKNGGNVRLKFPTFQSLNLFPEMNNLEIRREHEKKAGIEMDILSTWIDLYGYDLEKDQLVEFSRLVNSTLHKEASKYPDEFKLLATLPLPYGKEAADELQYFVKEKGFVGAIMNTNVLGINPDSSLFLPLWEMAEKLDVPVLLHPTAPTLGGRLDRYYLRNLIGNPNDTNIAATSLIFGGIMDRFPKLKVILVHGGGYFPYGIGRFDHGYNVRNEPKVRAKNKPSDYLKRFYYDTITYRPEILKYLVDTVSADNVLLGTDAPFDMEPEDSVGMVKRTMGDKAPAILSGNSAKLFHLH